MKRILTSEELEPMLDSSITAISVNEPIVKSVEQWIVILDPDVALSLLHVLPVNFGEVLSVPRAHCVAFIDIIRLIKRLYLLSYLGFQPDRDSEVE